MKSLDWDRIEELFAGALARDPAERNAWLDSECGDDSRLRAEIEALLSAHHQAEESRFSIGTASEHISQQVSHAASLVGQKLDRFLVEKHLGAGGMGDVYQALDTRLGRNVALKVCARNFSDRFESEAQSIAALNHPNICTLHDVGPNYLVMELVEGPTLAERIAGGPIRELEALAIAFQIANAIEAAHEKHIVHRDLKPANIKIAPPEQSRFWTSVLPRQFRMRIAPRRLTRWPLRAEFCSELPPTCRPNKRRAELSTGAAISGLSALFYTKCWLASRLSGQLHRGSARQYRDGRAGNEADFRAAAARDCAMS